MEKKPPVTTFGESERKMQSRHLNLPYFLDSRHADPGDAAPRHTAHAGQRSVAVFLCVFHFWHRRRPTLGGNLATKVRPGSAAARWSAQVSIICQEEYLGHRGGYGRVEG